MQRPEALFHGLSDPTRLALFERLAATELTVGHLTEGSGVSQPAVSKHLAVLKAAGMIEARPDGRRTFYRARPEALAPMIDWLGHYAAFWPARFDALEDLLKRMDN